MPELITDSKAFETKIKSQQLSVIHFSADFADQCKQVDDVLDVLSQQSDYSNVVFLKCHAEDLSEVSLKYQIEAVPTVIYFKSGAKVDRIDGADAAKITEKVKQHAAGSVAANASGVPLEERLKALVSKANVMLFMKGNRSTPRCGFSRQIIDILNGTGAPYETFDILSDEEVRQGLKIFSDWPTYPQLYVKGELVGGLDIVKEIQAAGELAATLNG